MPEPSTSDSPRCTHCTAPIRPDGQGDWIHERGLYRCQSNAVAYGHLAHPASVPCRWDGPNPCLGASNPHQPVDFGGCTVCTCGDFNCASLDMTPSGTGSESGIPCKMCLRSECQGGCF